MAPMSAASRVQSFGSSWMMQLGELGVEVKGRGEGGAQRTGSLSRDSGNLMLALRALRRGKRQGDPREVSALLQRCGGCCVGYYAALAVAQRHVGLAFSWPETRRGSSSRDPTSTTRVGRGR